MTKQRANGPCLRSALLLIGLSVALTGGTCGDDAPPADQGPPSEAGADSAVDSTPPPDFIKFHKAGESAEVDAVATNTFLVVPYSVSSQEATSISFSIKVESATGKTDFPLRIKRPAPLSSRNPALWARWQRRLAVEAWTRGIRVAASRSRMSLPAALLRKRPSGNTQTYAACTKSSECATNEVCHVAACTTQLTLSVEKFASSKEITVDVKRKGDHVAILVEGTTMTDGDLDGMLEAFDKTIYPRDVALFGNPPLKSGEATLSTDRNADGLVWIVITDKVSDKKQAVGFFVANDFTDATTSNKSDILWMSPPETQGDLKRILPTMAHEFQHLLGYAVKVYKPTANGGTGNLEALWLDEGLSHFAEDACGFGGENTTLLDQEVFTAFGDKAMISGVDNLVMRGQALTFVRYLFEQKGGVSYETGGGITDGGGAAWLKALNTSDKTGAEGVTVTYGDYKAALDAWIATIALDGRGVAGAERYGYKPLITDPVTSNEIGLRIRGKRKDNTGADVDLQGPIEDALSTGDKAGTVANSTGKLFTLTGQTGKVKITVTTQETDFRFLVIKIK